MYGNRLLHDAKVEAILGKKDHLTIRLKDKSFGQVVFYLTSYSSLTVKSILLILDRMGTISPKETLQKYLDGETGYLALKQLEESPHTELDLDIHQYDQIMENIYWENSVCFLERGSEQTQYCYPLEDEHEWKDYIEKQPTRIFTQRSKVQWMTEDDFNYKSQILWEKKMGDPLYNQVRIDGTKRLKDMDLPPKQKELFSQTVCECGGDLVVHFTEGKATTMNCFNPHCFHKIAIALEDFLEDLGVKGLKKAGLIDAVEHFWRKNLINGGSSKVSYKDLLIEDLGYYMSEHRATIWEEFITKLKSGQFSDRELIQKSGLPDVGAFAAESLNRQQIEELLTKKDFRSFYFHVRRYKIKSERVAYDLWVYLEDLKTIMDFANPKSYDQGFEYVCVISDSVLLTNDKGETMKFGNKAQFIEHVNQVLKEMYPDKAVRVVMKNSFSKDIDAVINDSGSSTSKVTKAKAAGVPVLTSAQFIGAVIEGVKNNA